MRTRRQQRENVNEHQAINSPRPENDQTPQDASESRNPTPRAQVQVNQLNQAANQPQNLTRQLEEIYENIKSSPSFPAKISEF